MFLLIFILGITNIWLLNKQAKFRKPIFAFYASSLSVIAFRILLFLDPLVKWPYNIYVIVLVSMPSYLFLIVGMSQVMLSVECIIKYKNFEIKETESATTCKKQEKVDRNNKILKFIYISIGIFSLMVLGGFAILQISAHVKATQ